MKVDNEYIEGLFIHDVGPLTTNETVTSVAGVMEIESP